MRLYRDDCARFADEFSVRLSGESRGGLSMVEVWSDGMWRGVCEEGEEEGRGWGKEEAIVTCRQLGYFGDDIVTGSVTRCRVKITF